MKNPHFVRIQKILGPLVRFLFPITLEGAENLPDVVYANLYGPTETFVCTGYVRTGKEPEGQPLPIGKALMNTQALVLDENGKEVAKGETSRMDCISSASI